MCDHGEVRTNNVQYGRVEVCIDGVWGTICDAFWDNRDASVICHQLGYSPYGNNKTMLFTSALYNILTTTGATSLSRFYVEYNLPILITDINCNGSEESFLNCSYSTLSNHNCRSYHDASVVCKRKQYLLGARCSKLMLYSHN